MGSGISGLRLSNSYAPKILVETYDHDHNCSTWSMTIPSRELKKAQEAIEKAPKSSGILTSLLMPTRTNSNDFATDLFFPTLLNQAKRVENVIQKFFVSIGSIFLDLASLPIRLLTTLPRVIYCKKFQSETPFHKFLADMKVCDEILSRDCVYVNLEWEEIGNRLYEKGPNKRVRVHNTLGRAVNLTDAPSYSKNHSLKQKVTILRPSTRKEISSKLNRFLGWIKSWIPGKKN